MKFSSKNEFVTATDQQWGLLWQCVDGIEQSKKNQQALKQILAHLHGWHRLLEAWYRDGLMGTVDLPAAGFKWNQTAELNAKIDNEYAGLSMASVKQRVKLSHGRIMKMVAGLSNKKFNTPGQFAWTGKNALSSYVVPNTFSHYRWAIKKIKRL